MAVGVVVLDKPRVLRIPCRIVGILNIGIAKAWRQIKKGLEVQCLASSFNQTDSSSKLTPNEA